MSKEFNPHNSDIPKIEKQLGDAKIKEHNFEGAINHYKNSIMSLKILFDDDTSLTEDDKKATQLIEEIGIPVHLNLALCYLKMKDWNNVVFYCNKVLELKPDNVKALYRKCKALLELKEVSKKF
jgi:tetratricopeptide (TPR) repeat protein